MGLCSIRKILEIFRGLGPSPNGEKTTLATRVRQTEQRLMNLGLTKELGLNIEGLDIQREKLQFASGDLEKKFLDIGAGLERLSADSATLLKRCEELKKSRTQDDSDHGILDPLVELINSPLEFLANCETQFEGLTSDLYQADQQIRNLMSSMANIQRAVAPLAFLQVLFRVESVRLPADRQQMFTTLTNEIQEFRGNLLNTFSERREMLLLSLKTINKGAAKLDEIVDCYQRTTHGRRLQVEQTLGDLRQGISDQQSRDTGFASVSAEISKKVGQIVMGIQSQDIISQRLSHVLDGFKDLLVQWQEARLQENQVGIDEFASRASQVTRVLSEQLTGILEEACRAETAIQSGLECILQSIQGMEKIAGLNSGDTSSKKDGSKAEQLNSLIESLQEPILHTHRQIGVACDLVKPLGDQVCDLYGITMELSDSIRLSGLNAQVENGGGLEVLSARTSSIASETKTVAGQVCKELELFANGLMKIVGSFNELREQALQHRQVLVSGGQQNRQHLDEIHKQNETDAWEVSQLALSVKQTVYAVQSDGRFRAGLSDTISKTLECLEEIGSVADKYLANKGIAVVSDKILDKLRSNYTMASEISAHDKAVESIRNGAVEGTDEMERMDAMVIAPNVMEEFSSDRPSLETFISDESPAVTRSTTSESAPVESGADLGSNIELF